MRTTIRDIATKTGFSIATVSMILNGKDSHISEKTRNIVLAAAKEMNYVPNHAAITFKSHRSHLLGLICPDITNDYYAKVASGLADASDGRGYNILLCNTGGSVEREKKYIDVFCSKNIDGAVIFNAAGATAEDIHSEIRKLESFNIAVRMEEFTECVDFRNTIYISPDYYGGGCLAAEHLLALGHKKVAMIEGPQQFAAAQNREKGFLQTMEKAGAPVPPQLRFPGSYVFESGVRNAAAIIESGVSAVFATNDMMAIGLIHELEKLGVRVPEDISVVGFDNTFLGEISEAHLTTINNPAYEVGYKTGEMLCDVIEKKAEPGAVAHLPMELVVRSSTAPAKQK